MSLQDLTALVVGFTFVLYIGIAFWTRANSTSEFYIAGKHVPPVANGMATAADWMSAASLSAWRAIAFLGYEGSMTSWAGPAGTCSGLLLAPYLRTFGNFNRAGIYRRTVDSDLARFVPPGLIFISFTYVAGQMRGVGIVFSRFLEVQIDVGLAVGMGIVFIYAVLGGMKGITYTQVAQYCVLIFAYTVPAVFISMQLTGNPVPQLALGSTMADGSGDLLLKLDQVLMDLGFNAYTHPFNDSSMINVLAITFALMAGTAGLPHVIVRFFTVPRVEDARRSAAWALVFIALLYTVAPAVGGLARLNLITTVNGADGTGTPYDTMPGWFRTWENSGLIAWYDHNHDGKVQHAAGLAFAGGKPVFDREARGESGQRLVTNPGPGDVAEGAPFANEIYVDRDIMVLANPEIAGLPDWVIALIAAGGIAAALSTAAGLLLVISVAVSHDILKSTFAKNLSDKQELTAGRIAAAVSMSSRGIRVESLPRGPGGRLRFGWPPRPCSRSSCWHLQYTHEQMGRRWPVCYGLIPTMGYIIYFKGVFVAPMAENVPANWLLGISPEGIGTVGMVLNLCVALTVSQFTAPPSVKIRALVERIRMPEDPDMP